MFTKTTFQNNHPTLRLPGALLSLLLLALLSACQSGPPRVTLTVLGGSELSDLAPILNDVADQSGVTLDVTSTGTVDGTERLLNGAAPDLVWFASDRTLRLQPQLKDRLLTSERIMRSPVVLGVRQSDARRWGWTNRQVSWKDILVKAENGELHYGMTNPASSNSGLAALIGVVSAISGRGDAITAADVNAPELKSFFTAQALTSGSSGWLSEAYVRDQAKVNGLINYESVLLSLNAGGKLNEPLTLVYPSDGVVTADYPLILMNRDRQTAYDTLVAALRSPEIQARIMNETHRRPAVSGVPLSPEFPAGLQLELPYPGSAAALDAVTLAFLQDTRVPANTIFVLDTSGSMEGDRIAALKTSLTGLAGGDSSLTGRFVRFAPRERVTFIPFSSDVKPAQVTEIGAAPGTGLADLRRKIAALTLGGGTNIYGALEAAYREAAKAPAGRYTSIVLMTDGENNAGPSADAFRAYYNALPANVRPRTFTIHFGDGNVDAMNDVATLTGGRTFDGTKNLQAAFKQIRGYQ